MHLCRQEGERRPSLSFRIGKEVASFRVELAQRCFIVRDYPTMYRAEEGTVWVLMPRDYFVWNQELGCEVRPSEGKRFYLSSNTQDPFHFLMEW